jgi:hypothetical protein
LVELAYGAEKSTCAWEVFDDGDLELTVKV